MPSHMPKIDEAADEAFRRRLEVIDAKMTAPEWHLATAADILRAQVPTILPEEAAAKSQVLDHLRKAQFLIARLRDDLARCEQDRAALIDAALPE